MMHQLTVLNTSMKIMHLLVFEAVSDLSIIFNIKLCLFVCLYDIYTSP